MKWKTSGTVGFMLTLIIVHKFEYEPHYLIRILFYLISQITVWVVHDCPHLIDKQNKVRGVKQFAYSSAKICLVAVTV